LRKCSKHQAQKTSDRQRRRVKTLLRKNRGNTKVSEEGERGGAPGTGAGISLEIVEDHTRADILSAAHGGPHTGVD